MIFCHWPRLLWFSSLTFIPPCSSKHLILCWRSPSSLSRRTWQASCSSGVAGGRTLATMTNLKLSIQASRLALLVRSRPFPWTSLKWLPSPAVPLLSCPLSPVAVVSLPHLLYSLAHRLDVVVRACLQVYITQLEVHVYFLWILYSLFVFVLMNFSDISSILLQQTHLCGKCCLQLPTGWLLGSPWPFHCLALIAILATLGGCLKTTGISGISFLRDGSLWRIGVNSFPICHSVGIRGWGV